jgi:hypothetical protein
VTVARDTGFEPVPGTPEIATTPLYAYSVKNKHFRSVLKPQSAALRMNRARKRFFLGARGLHGLKTRVTGKEFATK